MSKDYCPNQGHLITIEFDQEIGSEIRGRRPAIVLSHYEYNNTIGLALICPITSQEKGLPFEVILPKNLPVSGVILSDQIKCLDWQMRSAKFKCKVPPRIVDDVIAKFETLYKKQN